MHTQGAGSGADSTSATDHGAGDSRLLQAAGVTIAVFHGIVQDIFFQGREAARRTAPATAAISGADIDTTADAHNVTNIQPATPYYYAITSKRTWNTAHRNAKSPELRQSIDSEYDTYCTRILHITIILGNDTTWPRTADVWSSFRCSKRRWKARRTGWRTSRTTARHCPIHKTLAIFST